MSLCVPARVQAAADTRLAAVKEAVMNSGVFPEGTSVVGMQTQGSSVTVELSPEAAPFYLGDAQSDAMVRAIRDALAPWPEIKSVEVTVLGKPLWTYLPQSSIPPSKRLDMTARAERLVASLTSELAGKKIALHPSHGSYWSETSNVWVRAQRTLCGPNPINKPPGWTGSTYLPSDYYYYTKSFQWGSMYEDDVTPEIIRFLQIYCESSGATVWVSRELNKSAGLFPYATYGYPNCPFTLQKWMVAAKYYLQDRGDVPQWVWDEPTLTAQLDKDIRARPYYANFRQCDVSFSLHSNAGTSGSLTGTETYYYTAKYPVEQARSLEFATTMNNAAVAAINNYFDDTYGKDAYPPIGGNPPEWPTPTVPYTGYTSWTNRGGDKSYNFGEVREAMCPAALCEIAFHDDWRFYPDNLFLQDQIWRATVAWGFYEGLCSFFGVTPKPQLAATVVSTSFPATMTPGQKLTCPITVRNDGMSWCWGNKWRGGYYEAYTIWRLAALSNDPFAPNGKVILPPGSVIHPGNTVTFNVQLTAPSTPGLYQTRWQMHKNDLKGSYFGPVISAYILVRDSTYRSSIASAKAEPNGTEVTLVGHPVTAVFGDVFYVEDADRSCGVRVEKAGHTLTTGKKAYVRGIMRTNADGERYIDATAASEAGEGTVNPLLMSNRSIGGGGSSYDPDTATGQCGLKEYRSGAVMNLQALNNVGLLVATTGRVTYSGDGFFYLDDGSNLDDGQGHTGLRVLGTATEGAYVKVTGISSCFRSGDSLFRLLRATNVEVLQ